MKQNYRMAMSCAAIVFFSAVFGLAEDIRNYNNCEVCPGTIHYTPEESRKILGVEGLTIISKLARKEKTVKIDLDGVLKNGTEGDNDMRYDVEIKALQHLIYINDIRDESYIQITTDYQNSQQSDIEKWFPEIYLQSGASDKISLKDSVQIGWDKLKKSNIYRWVFSGKGNRTDLLKEKILYALKLIEK